jgi:hypothetical protein
MPANNKFSDNPIFTHLLEGDHLTSEDVLELTRRSRADCMPLEQVLVKHRIISVQQLMEVLAIRDEQPKVLIGELCVQSGYCTEDDLESALALQGRSAAHGLTVLLDQREAPDAELLAAIGGYVKGLEHQVANLESETMELRVELELSRGA